MPAFMDEAVKAQKRTACGQTQKQDRYRDIVRFRDLKDSQRRPTCAYKQDKERAENVIEIPLHASPLATR